jgi:hypothetical protein
VLRYYGVSPDRLIGVLHEAEGYLALGADVVGGELAREFQDASARCRSLREDIRTVTYKR